MHEEDEIYMLLKAINQQLYACAQERYRPYGLTSVQFAVLLELIEKDHQNVTQLGANLAMSKSNISAVLQRMEAHDFIKRVKMGNDQRSVQVELSEKGKHCIVQMKQASDCHSTPFQHLSKEELTQILNGLRLLYNIVKESEEHE